MGDVITGDPDMGRLYALFVLAWALIRSLAAGLLGTRRGLADFRRSYAADRLPPLSADERAQTPGLSRCIACGLCADLGRQPEIRIARQPGSVAGSSTNDVAHDQKARGGDEEAHPVRVA